MSLTKRITHENLKIQVIDVEKGTPYYIKNNNIVLCAPGRQFSLSFEADEDMNVTVWLQGSPRPIGTFRVNKDVVNTFDHGETQATWFTVDSGTQEAKEVGVVEKDKDNGMLRFKVQRPKRQQQETYSFFCSPPPPHELPKPNTSSRRIFDFGSRSPPPPPPPESTKSVSPAFGDDGASRVTPTFTFGVPPPPPPPPPPTKYKEVGIVHGHDSTIEYHKADKLVIDPSRTMEFTARMVATDIETPKPKFKPISRSLSIPPTAEELNSNM